MILEIANSSIEVELNSNEVKVINFSDLLQIALSKKKIAEIGILPEIPEELIKRANLIFREMGLNRNLDQ